MKTITSGRRPFALSLFNGAISGAMVLLTWTGTKQGLAAPETDWLPIIVSWLGLLGTVGLAHARTWNFPFNMAQNLFAAVVGFRSRLYGDAFMSLFYFSSQFYGIGNWNKHTKKDGTVQIEKRSNWRIILYAILLGFVLLGGVSWLLGGAFIFLDALNNATAIVAQVLQMKRHRASWYLWMATNLIGTVIWFGVGVPQMALMYGVFTLNSVRGAVNWSQH